jgi:hypothetical protein
MKVEWHFSQLGILDWLVLVIVIYSVPSIVRCFTRLTDLVPFNFGHSGSYVSTMAWYRRLWHPHHSGLFHDFIFLCIGMVALLFMHIPR